MLNFDEVLRNSRMNFLLTTNWLSVSPAHAQRVFFTEFWDPYCEYLEEDFCNAPATPTPKYPSKLYT